MLKAREFESIDGKKKIAVLSPRKSNLTHYRDFRTKLHFFTALYPTASVKMIIQSDEDTDENLKDPDFRLILPLIPGEPHRCYQPLCAEEQIRILISAIHAIKRCHQVGYVVVDFKHNNILYDEISTLSNLIDGGLATKVGEELPDTLVCDSRTSIKEHKKTYWHIAPECWGLSGSQKVAATSMDIYSFGVIFRKLIFYNSELAPGLKVLFSQCEAINPADRPTLDVLEERLLQHQAELLSTESFYY